MDYDCERKASEFMVEAESKLADPKGVDEAVECYQQAGDLFRKTKNWYQAGKAYSEAAKLLLEPRGKRQWQIVSHTFAFATYLPPICEPGKRFTAGTNYANAFKCYRKSDKQQAINSVMEAIDIFADIGRFTLAAEYHQALAEMYKDEVDDLQHANQHYEQAYEYFTGEESPSEANKCILKVAQIAAHLEDYEKAISIYEEIASSYVDIPLLQLKTIDYLFRASLCHLTTGLINGQDALERYAEAYPVFEKTNEYKLLHSLCEHLEEANIDGFSETIEDYEDSNGKFKDWYQMLLLRIKSQYKSSF